MVSFELPQLDTITRKEQSPKRKQGTEDSEHPTEEETDIEGQEVVEIEEIVEENASETDYYFLNNRCCSFWIIAFVVIMIFSRDVVHAFFEDYTFS